MSLTSQVAIVTGASSGIGAAIAVLFTKQDADVVIVGRNQDKLNKVSQLCEKQGKKPLVINADVSNDDAAKNIVNKAVEKYGKLDILINNAGFLKNGTLLEGNILEAYDAMIATNVRAVIHLTSLAAPHLVKTKGKVINISSVAATKVNRPASTSYSVTKAALNHFTRGAALELAPHGVRVNVLSPGPVRTDFLENAGLTGINYKDIEQMTPLKRVTEPEELANLALFVVSDKAKSITGADLTIDTGYLLATSALSGGLTKA